VRDIANFARMDERKHLAIRLLKRGTPVEEVIDLTELSKDQVLELLRQAKIYNLYRLSHPVKDASPGSECYLVGASLRLVPKTTEVYNFAR